MLYEKIKEKSEKRIYIRISVIYRIFYTIYIKERQLIEIMH